MNDNYLCEVLNAMGEKLNAQSKTIYFQSLEIQDLKERLAEAEYHLNPSEDNEQKLQNIKEKRA